EAKYKVLNERQELKYAALDSWKAVAEIMPSDLLLDTYTFSEGKKVALRGSCPASQLQQVYNFDSEMRRYTREGQPLFDALIGDRVSSTVNPGGSTMNWNFSVILKRSEGP